MEHAAENHCRTIPGKKNRSVRCFFRRYSALHVKSELFFIGLVTAKTAADNVVVDRLNADFFAQRGIFFIIKIKGKGQDISYLKIVDSCNTEPYASPGNILDYHGASPPSWRFYTSVSPRQLCRFSVKLAEIEVNPEGTAAGTAYLEEVTFFPVRGYRHNLNLTAGRTDNGDGIIFPDKSIDCFNGVGHKLYCFLVKVFFRGISSASKIQEPFQRGPDRKNGSR